jgi:hypothetical protein
MLSTILLGLATLWHCSAATIRFQQDAGAYLLADASTGPTIIVGENDSPSLLRAAGDFAADFGRVTGSNGTVQALSDGASIASSGPIIIAGTLNGSDIITSMIRNGTIDASGIEGQWEAYITQLVSNPAPGLDQAFVIVGSDRRGAIFGIYDISSQMGVSPWHWWADVPAQSRDSVFIGNGTRVQPSPAVKYRGIFINDEQPALSNWLDQRVPRTEYGTDNYDSTFYASVFELLLRLKANYMWPTTWSKWLTLIVSGQCRSVMCVQVMLTYSRFHVLR